MDIKTTTSTKTGMEIIRFQSPTTIWSRHQNIPDDEHDYWESEFRRLEGIPANQVLPRPKPPYTFKNLFDGCKTDIFISRHVLTVEECRERYPIWNIYLNYIYPSVCPIMTLEEFKNFVGLSEEKRQALKALKDFQKLINTPRPSFIQYIKDYVKTKEGKYWALKVIGCYSLALGISSLISPIIPIAVACAACLVGIGIGIKNFFKPKPPAPKLATELTPKFDYEKWRKEHGRERGLRPGEWDQL